jgi:LacI family transcriptional regulator
MKSRSTTAKRGLTILDVAQAAGVSKSTVSLVLQGSPLIRDETAQRVHEAAWQLGYVYNRQAADLRRQSSNTIGVIINDLTNPFFTELLVGVERKLVDAGYVVLMAHTHEDVSRQRKVLLSMREQNTAGIVICPAQETPLSLPEDLRGWNIPSVIMIRPLGAGSYDFVGAHNSLGIQMAMRHLIGLGHKRIGFLGGTSGAVHEERLSGYRQALKEAKLPLVEKLVVASKPNRAGGRDAMTELLKAKPKPTAAVCYNDITALGALTALGDHGLRAGVDFALVGFDNVLDTAQSNPPLSTIDINPAQLGEKAAMMLLNRIQTPSIERQLFLSEPSLLLRQSC